MNTKTAKERPLLYIIVNPASHSGKGIVLASQVKQILQEQNVPYEMHFSRKQGDVAVLARQLTKDIPEGEERRLVVLGGDGTVNEAMQGIEHFDRVRFSYIPSGSSNDLARDMGIGKDPGKTIKAALEKEQEELLDVGCMTWQQEGEERKRYFLVGCGIGYDAAVCAETFSSKLKGVLNKVGLGKLTYLGIGLKEMLTAEYVQADICLDDTEKIHLNKMLFTANMLHRYEGGGFCFCPQADAQDGLVDLCVVNDVPRRKVPIIIPFALAGKHYRFDGVTAYRASKVAIKTSAPLWVQTDGEIPGRLDQFTVTVEKQKLRFVY